MSAPDRPPINALVEVSLSADWSFNSRVEDVTGERIHLAAPLPSQLAGPPGPGDRLTVRWPAGPRGRYALPVAVVRTDSSGVPVLVVRPAGPADIEQHRQFVRGGGGETVRLRRVGSPVGAAVDGHVLDVGECSMRGRFARLNIAPGDEVVLQMALGDTVVPTTGRIMQVIGQPFGPTVDIVAVYDLGENLAQLVRRYVLRQQLLARNQLAEGLAGG